MQIQTRNKVYTPEEYLFLEENAEDKHEYLDGEIISMTGGTTNHNEITGNLYAYLKFALKGKNYRIFIGDVRLWIPDYNLYTYPDLMVIEDKPAYHQTRTDTVTNPLIIVEVLSKSTANYDRGDKFKFYRSIPEFKEYILIDQYQFYIEQYVKTSEEKWEVTYYESEESRLKLATLDFEIVFSDLYERVDFKNQDI
ncbi:MAG: Uma2 family endonuclease [Okeania sp. SIO3B5]|uniref:Uma2 family endonuclease n=1 Tax=Okeania sp. SIO3B5 TaxID=2607811 RepID=UPI0014008C71|nr:Uma2 family endonuclease [Okeania sp. SIO3B5]NEO56018.1 Uma2 family endonuclease [Okeania sp. SIO3B5]